MSGSSSSSISLLPVRISGAADDDELSAPAAVSSGGGGVELLLIQVSRAWSTPEVSGAWAGPQ